MRTGHCGPDPGFPDGADLILLYEETNTGGQQDPTALGLLCNSYRPVDGHCKEDGRLQS